MKPKLHALSVLVCCAVLVAPVAAEESVMISPFVEHMHGHLDQLSAMKSAVIAGDLAQTRDPASWLATHDAPQDMPDVWMPYVLEMRRYAARAANAEDLVTAAAAISEIARSCGGCHRASGFAVAFGFDEKPPQEQQSLKTEMQRHLWAADRMWEGLIGPSDRAWDQGTEMLSEAYLSIDDIAAEPENQAEIVQLIQRARFVGAQGSQATSVELRSGLYGELLALCATCHRLTGGGPGR